MAVTGSSTTPNRVDEHQSQDGARTKRAREGDLDVALLHRTGATRSTRHRATRTKSICWTRRVLVPAIRTRRHRRRVSTSNGFSSNSTQDGFSVSTDGCRRQHYRCDLWATSQVLISWPRLEPRFGSGKIESPPPRRRSRHASSSVMSPTRLGMVRSSNSNKSCPMSTVQRAGCDDIITGVPQLPYVARSLPLLGGTPAERADAGCWHYSSSARSSRSRRSMTFCSR